MPKGWYIYDSNMSTSDKWRNFMSTPAGSMTMFGGAASVLPEGWLLCDGSAYSTTSHPEYEDLYAVIANTYGGTDGTDFQVPNLKGRMAVGLDSTQTEFDAMGETGGSKTHTLTESELPSHTHDISLYQNGNESTNTAWFGGQATGSGTATTDGGSGSGSAHQNMPPYVVVNYIIKY
tara:strand:+ start:4100 stop:4630 length:531 start_codon:yes stop_codon:yes gene_type:complete